MDGGHFVGLCCCRGRRKKTAAMSLELQWNLEGLLSDIDNLVTADSGTKKHKLMITRKRNSSHQVRFTVEHAYY